MQVSIEDAYAEACKALGEATVRERLMGAEVQRLTAELAAQSKPEDPPDMAVPARVNA